MPENAKCIGGEDPRLHRVLRVAYFLASSIEAAFKVTGTTVRQSRWVTWHQSEEPVVVVNVDGSSLGNPGPAGFGGLIRMGDGEWCGGFFGSIGTADNLSAELAALQFGLSIAWESRARNLVCYSDFAMAIALVSSSSVLPTHCNAALIEGIQELLRRDWEVWLLHTLREGNSSADALAKLGAAQSERLVVLSTPSAAIGPLLLADAMRVPHLRD